jgi:hypothetical protein
MIASHPFRFVQPRGETETGDETSLFNSDCQRFIRLIIRTFQLVFSAETVFFFHNKSANNVFQSAQPNSPNGRDVVRDTKDTRQLLPRMLGWFRSCANCRVQSNVCNPMDPLIPCGRGHDTMRRVFISWTAGQHTSPTPCPLRAMWL